MNVLLVSEGQHELGRESRDGGFGAVTTLVRRTATRQLTCTTMKVSDHAFSHVHGSGGKLFKRAMRCMLYAAEHGFDALIFVIDQDDEPGRRHFLDMAQQDLRVAIGRAFGLAVRTFDAWIIADEQALTDVLKRSVSRQPDPEEIRDAKGHCRQLRGDNQMSLTDLYEGVAQTAAVAKIEERCPRGFAPFAARLRQL